MPATPRRFCPRPRSALPAVWPGLCALALVSLAEGGAQVPDAADALLQRLMRISRVTQFQWSPSGSDIAYVSNESGTPQLHLYTVATGHRTQLTRHAAPVIDPQWDPTGRTLVFASDPMWQERYELWQVDAQTGVSRPLLSDTGVITRSAGWAPDGSRLLVETNASGNFDLALWSPEDPVLRPLVRDRANEAQAQWAPDGRSVVFLRAGVLWRVDLESRRSEELLDIGLGGAIASPRWSSDGASIAFLTDLAGNWDLGVLNVSTRTLRIVEAGPEEAAEPAWSPDGRRIAFVSTHGFDKHVRIVDVTTGQTEYVAGKGGVCASPRWSPRGDQLAFLMSTPQQTWDLWVYAQGGVRQLTDSMGGWRPSELVAPEAHTYTSREGFPVPALFYRGQGRGPSSPGPLVMLVHGSFTGQWVNDFDVKNQYLLLRGVSLLAPNPRGSGGYGRAYERLNDGDWGGGDYDDLVRAHEHATQVPGVDPGRLAVWGGSYGGYLTFTLVARAPELFRAAVVRAGISDLTWHLAERRGSPARFNDSATYTRELGGLPDEHAAFYRDRSPLTWVRHVKTPMLILHGLRDSRVAPSQSRLWVEALREQGVPVEHREYPDEDHSLERSKDTVADQLRRIGRFLDRYLTCRGDAPCEPHP
jgi:dipeptidyl aminopeptidase/acylaminoacyl peptidase